MLAGQTMDEVGSDTFDGDLLGADPRASFETIVERSCAAAGAVRDLDHVAHLSFGDHSIREYLWQIHLFRGVRAYEIARIIGYDTSLPPELVQGLWDEVRPNAEEWRSPPRSGSPTTRRSWTACSGSPGATPAPAKPGAAPAVRRAVPA